MGAANAEIAPVSEMSMSGPTKACQTGKPNVTKVASVASNHQIGCSRIRAQTFGSCLLGDCGWRGDGYRFGFLGRGFLPRDTGMALSIPQCRRGCQTRTEQQNSLHVRPLIRLVAQRLEQAPYKGQTHVQLVAGQSQRSMGRAIMRARAQQLSRVFK